MRRILKILSVIFLIFFVWLLAFAFIEPFQNWSKATYLLALGNLFGGIYNAVTSSAFWQSFIAPSLNSALIGLTIGIILYHFLLRPAFTKVRTKFVRSAAKDSGMYPTMTEPVSQPTVATPTPVSTKQEPSPTPAPQPAPTPAEETAK